MKPEEYEEHELVDELLGVAQMIAGRYGSGGPIDTMKYVDAAATLMLVATIRKQTGEIE